MTRERDREIKQAAAKRHSFHSETREGKAAMIGFMEGARWADKTRRDNAHWISVEDELPEEEQYVLACNDKGFFMPAKYSNGVWLFHWALENQLLGVVYWMPMPTLPNKHLAEASEKSLQIQLEYRKKRLRERKEAKND